MSYAYVIGDFVPWHFEAGTVVGSFFASLTGTVLCVELLHRKRLGKSIASRVQLLLCAVAMGLIGIWCMHFIGNRSIVLGAGETYLQLDYSPGYTFLSCVLPVIGLSMAFYIAELRISNVVLRRLLDLLTGFLAGTSIVGMHYCGNVGTTNYNLHYPPQYIIAAAIIAIGDCIIALMLFFYFKEKWISVFWKRFVCATLLSVAVCGMHYTASVGCTYELIKLNPGSATRNVPFIVAGVLCAAAAVSTIIILFWTSRRNRTLADKAQQVNVACAYFDDEGNIMVNNEGLLPSQKIAKRFTLQTFDDAFNTGHPVFHWIWKVSKDWESVTDLVPRMRSHLRRHDPYSRHASRPTTSGSIVSEGSFDEESYNDQTLLFRESFCIAVADLADRLQIRVDQMGNLFDRVTGTGIMSPTGSVARKMSQSDAASIASSSRGMEKGQLLFFARRLPVQDVDKFLANGYRFAPPNRVEAMIAKTMQLPIAGVAGHIRALHDYASNSSAASLVKQGTYLTCFAALGRISRHFDVLVSRTHQDQLPDMQLTPQHLNQAQLNFLKQYDGWSAGSMVRDLKDKRARQQHVQADERGFILLLINSLSSLAHQISEEWFNDLTFNAKPIISKYGTGVGSASAMVFGLTKLLDIHQSEVAQPDRLTFVPLDFFRIRTAFWPGSADVAKFRSVTHTEFGSILSKDHQQQEKSSPHLGKGNKRNFISRKFSVAKELDEEDLVKKDTSSEHGVVSSDGFEPVPLSNKQMWGGILATTDTVIIETTHKSNSTMELKNLTPSVTATAILDNSNDTRTFADLLYAQAKFRGVTRPAERTPGS